MNRRKIYISILSIILGIIMILFQIISLYYMDYFAGDCIPRIIRFGLILFYGFLIIAGYYLLRNKGISRYFYFISGFGLIIISVIVFLINFDCGLAFIFYQHLFWGIVISIISFKEFNRLR